jgi:hypothetical protein
MGFRTFLKKAESWGKSALNQVKQIGNQTYQDGRGIVNFIGGQFAKNADVARAAVTNLTGASSRLIGDVGQGVKGLGEGLGNALPYLGLGALALGGIYLMTSGSNKRGMGQYSHTSSKKPRYTFGLDI